ncbi:DUF4249 domain-containing protein [Saccharicrinis fermentans]|uniref:DUF4249 domain-containing protein n=1 Tax=Saccharicrinis fermentans DSM 9555 = JCM 21142 TaxID=869213 RepID=W7YL74_9BACT|nr:DUF4249 domain-containing protein [Saccharicrinis fermentans]GAF03074.1 hypothetical protein JCM21142_41732 [Saccharicrinis fermentans DSM 9555 = JCM 21142]
MKSTTFGIIVILAIGLICGGCEKEVNYNGKEYTKKMVLNSMIDCSQDTHFIKISESVFVYSNQNPQPIDDANLEVKINNLPVGVVYDHSTNEHRYYRFEASLNPKDKIEVTGDSQSHGYVKGQDIVPNPPQILAVTPEWFTGIKDGISYLRTKIKIKDIPDEDNFYRIVIHDKVIFEESSPEEAKWFTSDIYVDQEILFKDILGTLGETNTSLFAIFSDKLFQGQEYLLNVYIRKDNFSALNAEHYVKVEILSLSENLYRYLRSLELATNGDNFSEPVKIFTNIDGGFGVFGSYTIDQQIVNID